MYGLFAQFVTFALLIGVTIAAVYYWITSSQIFLTRKMKKVGVETMGKIVDFRAKPFHATKVAYMMNVEYDTPEGTMKRYYKRIITKDRVIPYRDKYGEYFYKGQELPLAYLPDKPHKFVVLHPVEIDEKRRVNYLFFGSLLCILVLPWIIYGLKELFS